MRIVHYYPTALDGSGVTVALWAWVRATAEAGVDVVVVCAETNVERPWFDAPPPGVELLLIAHRGRRRMTRHTLALGDILRPGDVLVLHEGWVPANFVAAATAARRSIPFVVMPHGVYARGWRPYFRGPVALRERLERALLERAAAVHVFFATESGEVGALAPRAKLLIAPTGFDLPVERWPGGGEYLAWIGRYHPENKGLDLLVDAVALLPEPERPLIRLRGYDYGGGLARLTAHVAVRGVLDWVDVGPPIAGEAKNAFLLGSSGYVFPSRWDSLPLALVEALALGVPTLVSKSIRMAPSLEAAGAALLTEPQPEAVASGLQQLMAGPAMLGERGRGFVATELAWGRIVPRYLEDLARLRATS